MKAFISDRLLFVIALGRIDGKLTFHLVCLEAMRETEMTEHHSRTSSFEEVNSAFSYFIHAKCNNCETYAQVLCLPYPYLFTNLQKRT